MTLTLELSEPRLLSFHPDCHSVPKLPSGLEVYVPVHTALANALVKYPGNKNRDREDRAQVFRRVWMEGSSFAEQ